MAKLKPGKDYIGVGCGVFVVNEKSEVLLQLRSKNSKNEAGKWNKMGGSVEFGEKVIDCLQRETLEEAGIEITDIEFLSYTDHILSEEKQHWLGLNFMALIKPGEIAKNMEPEKFDDLRWFKFGEIPENLAMPTEDSLELMLSRYREKYSS